MDLLKLMNTRIPRIRGTKVKNTAIYLISFAREFGIKAIINAPRAGRNMINERMLKFNLLPPLSNYTLLNINIPAINAMIPSPIARP
jgi:hypothetical protein